MAICLVENEPIHHLTVILLVLSIFSLHIQITHLLCQTETIHIHFKLFPSQTFFLIPFTSIHNG